MTTTTSITPESEVPGAGSAESDPAPGASPTARIRHLLDPLFTPAAPRPITGRGVVLAVAAVLAATAYSLGRVGGPGALNSIWAEDASNFLTDAFTQRAVATVFEPVNGYFLVVPRLLTEFASLFPVSWSAGVLSASAALFTAGMGLLVYLASAALLPNRLARVVVAVGIVAAPVGENYFTNVLNSVAPLQFPMLFALFWTALWTPNRRWVQVVQVGFVLLCTISTFLAVIYLPLSLLRVLVRRDRLSLALLGGFLAGPVLQVVGLLSGISTRGDISDPNLNPIWALKAFVTWAVPFGLFGPEGVRNAGTTDNGLVFTGSGTGAAYLAAVVGAWLLVLAVVAIAALRWTRPGWLLAAVAGAHALGVLLMQIMVQGNLVLRYVFPASLLLVTALVALLLPAVGPPRFRAWAPLFGLTLIMVVAALGNYQSETLRTRSTPWDVKVAEATAFCKPRSDNAEAKVFMLRGYPWYVRIPCHRLR